jgi:hypothetical protein
MLVETTDCRKHVGFKFKLKIMSLLKEAKMPSLKDKIEAQEAEKKPESKVKKVVKKLLGKKK